MKKDEKLDFCYSIYDVEKFGNSITLVKLYTCKKCNFFRYNIFECLYCSNYIFCYDCIEKNEFKCLVCLNYNFEKFKDFELKNFLSIRIKCPKFNCNIKLNIDELEIHLKNNCKGNNFESIYINGYKKFDKEKNYNKNKETYFIEYFKNGNIKKKGFLMNNKMNGKGEEYLINGNLYYKGNFKEDLYEGLGEIFLNNEKLYEGEFMKGKLQKINSYYLLDSNINMIDNENIILFENISLKGSLNINNENIYIQLN